MTTERPAPYRPIDCDRHSVLELLAMRRTAVRADTDDASGVTVCIAGVVSDVVTRANAEYLVIVDPSFGERRVRLDRLRVLRDVNGRVVWRQ